MSQILELPSVNLVWELLDIFTRAQELLLKEVSRDNYMQLKKVDPSESVKMQRRNEEIFSNDIISDMKS